MPSTYSPSLRLELIGAGEQAANWNNTTNYNLGTLLEQAIAGVQSVAVSGASYTLTTGSGVADEARNAVLVLTGTLAAICNVIVPTADKTYTFCNATTGGFSVVVKTAAGSGVAIPNGFTQQVYCDATNVVAVGVPFNAATNTITTNVSGNVAAGAGSAAAPSVTFGDTDTGIYASAANFIDVAAGGLRVAAFTPNIIYAIGDPAQTESFLMQYNGGASASAARGLSLIGLNENSIAQTALRSTINTNGSGSIELYATPPGSRASDRRVLRATIPGSGAISLVGPVNVSSNLSVGAGSAAAPAYSFSGDTDTGVYSPGANSWGLTAGGAQRLFVDGTFFRVVNQSDTRIELQSSSASASVQGFTRLMTVNEGTFPVAEITTEVQTDGSSNISIYTTPSGSRTVDRRVLRATIPGSGAISLVGPVNVDGKALQIQRGTEQATTSGTAIDFTGIPSGVRRITVMFDAVSFNGSDGASIQLGDSGGIETTGYTGNTGIVAGLSSGTIGTLSTAAVVIYAGTAAVDNCSGVIHIVNQSGNKWLITGQTARNGTSQIYNVLAAKTLSDALDRIRFKVDGASSFDGGSINIMWEF